jgi:hypothetical protein
VKGQGERERKKKKEEREKEMEKTKKNENNRKMKFVHVQWLIIVYFRKEVPKSYSPGQQTWYIHQHPHILCAHLLHAHWDTDIYNHPHD